MQSFNFFGTGGDASATTPAGSIPPIAQPNANVLRKPMLNMPQISFKPVALRTNAKQGMNAGQMLQAARSPGLQVVQPQKIVDEEDNELKNLKDVRRSCGLKDVPVGNALLMFKSAAEKEGGASGAPALSSAGFVEAYTQLMKDESLDVPEQPTMMGVFTLFDRDNNGVVDMLELVCGVSMLCKGTEDEKIAAVFTIFDADGNGYISMDEMFKFLTSVFKIVLTPHVLSSMKAMGVEVESAEDLASVTSLECFKTADLNGDGKLSLDEFKAWFYAPKNDPGFMFAPMRKLLH